MNKTMAIMKQVFMVLIVLAVGQFAMAADPSVAVKKILLDPKFITLITWGLALYSGWLWFKYFADFDPGSAFKNIITPAIMTFLAFKWDWLLGVLMGS